MNRIEILFHLMRFSILVSIFHIFQHMDRSKDAVLKGIALMFTEKS